MRRTVLAPLKRGVILCQCMTQMQTSIEFHDSDLAACHIHDNMIVIELRPAYIHKWELINGKWIGSGCVQDAQIRIDNARAPNKMPVVPVNISDCTITIGGITFYNLIPTPFNMKGPSRLILQLVSGDTFEVSGGALSIALQGESKFVEKLPQEWAPGA